MRSHQHRDLAEALYHVRCLKALKPKGLLKTHVDYAEHPLVGLLRAEGLDPGTSAEEVDNLKLHCMGQAPAYLQEGGMVARGRVEAVLEEAAAVTGSGDDFRELGRFQLFCMRMKFSRPVDYPNDPEIPDFLQSHQGPLVEDDKEVPVYTWCRSQGRSPAITVAEAADLYLRWTEEVCKRFRERHHLDVYG
jgi:hypothetical protein